MIPPMPKGRMPRPPTSKPQAGPLPVDVSGYEPPTTGLGHDWVVLALHPVTAEDARAMAKGEAPLAAGGSPAQLVGPMCQVCWMMHPPRTLVRDCGGVKLPDTVGVDRPVQPAANRQYLRKQARRRKKGL